jgi:hypothetical protein
MTLILTLVTPFHVLQVSDRLVTTQSRTLGARTFDAFANKNLVFFARNALVTIGYTGLAYIDGAPTDHWLAEQLLDLSLPLEFGARMRTGPEVRLEDIGRVVERVRTRLISTFTRVGTPSVLQTFVFAGIQWNRRRTIRPMASIVSNSRGTPGLFLLREMVHRHDFFPIRGPSNEMTLPLRLITAPRVTLREPRKNR